MLAKKLITASTALALAFGAPLVNAQSSPASLDADGNGLYDDTERKALLDLLQAKFPELADNYDADGDGKVTIEEQEKGRHPLSVRIPASFLESGLQIPWTIDVFPEWISSAYLQDDLSPGEVAAHLPRGLISERARAGQEAVEYRPRKLRSGPGGVEFAADSGQHLLVPGHRDARWNYRWCIFTFRLDASTGSSDETVLLDINRGQGSYRSTPKITFSKRAGLRVQYVGQNVGGLDRRVMTTKNIVTDGKGWNVVVCGIRYGQLFVSVNGVPLSSETPQLPRFSGDLAPNLTSFIGDPDGGNVAWAYDALVFGLTEPSEAMVRKMTGWAAHRLGFQNRLPSSHPYASKRPVVDAEDFPTRFVPDEEKRLAWGQSLKKTVTRVNAGGPRVEPKGFERVFYDDFRAYRLSNSVSGEGDLWQGPGFNTAVGMAARLTTPGRKPDAYPYDAKKQQQTLSLVKDGKNWRGSAIYTVNDLGHGYTWKGRKVFRVRWMFPKVSQKDLAKGLFPAFWSYDPDFLFWRTANRIEIDWLEFDGRNGYYLNGLSTHLHYSHFRQNIFAKKPGTYQRYKVYGGDMTEEKSRIPGGLFVWDGHFHTWEFIVENDMTYINVTVPGKDGRDQWVEVYRTPTEPTYLQNLNLQIDYALKNHGAPASGERQDLVVDWVEVLQKTEDIEALPAVFKSRPRITGANRAGSTVKCEVELPGVTDVRYFWFADGYPLTWGPSPTYTLTAAEAGKPIRCMVKAVGARDMPEAWSNILK
jgi:hypothetical protein